MASVRTAPLSPRPLQLQKREVLKENQLKSTNLSHLEGLLYCAKSFGQTVAFLQSVQYEVADAGSPAAVTVDVVARGGLAWVKVTARKAEALHRKWEGGSPLAELDLNWFSWGFLWRAAG